MMQLKRWSDHDALASNRETAMTACLDVHFTWALLYEPVAQDDLLYDSRLRLDLGSA